jgi:predicted nucleic acid-binding protein
MKLSDICTGEWVVIDTGILVYANQQKCQECIQLLKRCAQRDVRGIVPMPVVTDLVHTLMLIEARENNWVEPTTAARTLADKPDLVRRLSRYENQVREFLGIGLRLEPTTSPDILEAMSIQREFGLFTNDALLLAIARRLNCTAIATTRPSLTRTRGFAIYQPPTGAT